MSKPQRFHWNSAPQITKAEPHDAVFMPGAVVVHRKRGRVVERHSAEDICNLCEKLGVSPARIDAEFQRYDKPLRVDDYPDEPFSRRLLGRSCEEALTRPTRKDQKWRTT